MERPSPEIEDILLRSPKCKIDTFSEKDTLDLIQKADSIEGHNGVKVDPSKALNYLQEKGMIKIRSSDKPFVPWAVDVVMYNKSDITRQNTQKNRVQKHPVLGKIMNYIGSIICGEPRVYSRRCFSKQIWF